MRARIFADLKETRKRRGYVVIVENALAVLDDADPEAVSELLAEGLDSLPLELDRVLTNGAREWWRVEGAGWLIRRYIAADKTF